MTSEFTDRMIRGRYRLISQLAVGGMGVTYRAWDFRAGGPVVIKMPRRPKGGDDDEFFRVAARFAREVEVMRALGHDHIVPIIDAGEDSGTPFVAMRFLPGAPFQITGKKKAPGHWEPIAASQLRLWLPSIAEALDFIHSRGVVHRDVKPANIFFDGFSNAFLGDFGIAKVLGDEAGLERGQTLTATHLAVGTPEYMAPELLLPNVTADGRADQYALAITVYELVSGRRPFTGAMAHILVEHATHPVPPLDGVALGLPPSMMASIQRALAKKPDERFANCLEFSRALLFDVPLQPSEPGVVRLLCPGCRKVLRVPHAAGGRKGNCPSCKQSMEIADDFSALWLATEATLVAEPPSVADDPILAAVDTQPVPVAEPAATVADAADAALAVRPWSFLATALLMLVVGAASASVAGLLTNSRWAAHHGRMLQKAADEQAKARTAHAGALDEASRNRLEAVAAADNQWRTRLAEAEQAWKVDLAAAEARLQEAEKKLSVMVENRRLDEERAAKLAEERAKVEPVAGPNPVSPLAESPNPGNVFTNSVGIALRRLPPGSFAMEFTGTSREKPFRRVTLTKVFYLGIDEVTNAQWKQVMGPVPSEWKEDSRPVVNVSWDAAVEFCRKVSAMPEEQQAGRTYRLPTEAEWEYACRIHETGTNSGFSFGDNDLRMVEHGWFERNSSGGPHEVGMKQPTPLGFHDLHGNVREWCADWYGAFDGDGVTDPQGPATGVFRVARGGGWNARAEACRTAVRYQADPSFGRNDTGFRVAMTLSGVVGIAKNPAVPESSRKEVVESRIRFTPESASVVARGKHYWLTSAKFNGELLCNFEGDREEAMQALAAIHHYGINERVALTDSRNDESFVYWLADGRAPVGFLPRTQCRSFDPFHLVVEGKTIVIDSDNSFERAVQWRFETPEMAAQVLDALQGHKFTLDCNLGGPKPHFRYLRR